MGDIQKNEGIVYVKAIATDRGKLGHVNAEQEQEAMDHDQKKPNKCRPLRLEALEYAVCDLGSLAIDKIQRRMTALRSW